MKPFLLILIATLFTIKSHAQTADTTIFTAPVEVMPEYKGGMERLYDRLEHNIRYLYLDRMKDVQGKVWVSLIIEKDGSINEVKMLRGLTTEEDAEILRVVRNLRKWKPGLQDGKPVRVQFTIPIDFKLIKT